MPGAPSKMKAVVLNKQQLQVTEVPIPVPAIGQLRVKMETTGVCHTDVHAAHGEVQGKLKKNLILGHEGVGLVDMIGQGIKQGFKVGDRVLIPWLGATCGTCEHCIDGHQALCDTRCATGIDVDGTYAEYVAVFPRSVILLPAGLSNEEAASLAPIACAGLTTYKALKSSGLRANQWVAICGAAGGLGHLAVQYANAMGFKVIAIDRGSKKMEFLQSLGATHYLDCDKTANLQQEVESLVPGGVHATLVLAPDPAAYQKAVQITARGGTVMCVALPKAPVEIDMQDVIGKGLKLKGSIVGDRQDLREALQFALEGKVKCIVHKWPLEQAAEVHQGLQEGNFEGRAVLMCCSPGCGKYPTESKQPGQQERTGRQRS